VLSFSLKLVLGLHPVVNQELFFDWFNFLILPEHCRFTEDTHCLRTDQALGDDRRVHELLCVHLRQHLFQLGTAGLIPLLQLGLVEGLAIPQVVLHPLYLDWGSLGEENQKDLVEVVFVSERD